MLLLEDRSLLEGYRAGRPEALARVFEHYHAQIVAMAQGGFGFPSGGRRVRFRGYRHSADLFDVVHDVFRAAFEEKARLGYGGLQPFGAYLATIARNLVVSRLRHDEVVPETEPLDAAHPLPAPGPTPEESALVRQQRAVVAEFLELLPPEERELTRLRFEEDLAQEKVALAMGVGRKKVRILEGRVRDKLRLWLRRRGMRQVRAPAPQGGLP